MTDSIFTAMLAAKSDLPVVIEKTSRGHHNSYAPLEDIIAKTTPVLAKHQIFMTQCFTVEAGQQLLRTRLIHGPSGTTLDSDYLIEVERDAGDAKLARGQVQGKAITYARRYALAAILGIGTGEQDLDGSPSDAPPHNGRATSTDPTDRPPTDAERTRFEERFNELAPTSIRQQASIDVGLGRPGDWTISTMAAAIKRARALVEAQDDVPLN